MVDKIDEKIVFKEGVKITWDQHGNSFVAMPVNNIPKKQFDEWIKKCKEDYSGKRWDMITADYLKARAYETLLLTIPEEQDVREDKEQNPMGLLNGGKD